MRICSTTSEAFIRRSDGFGKLIGIISRELARKGLDVCVTWDEEGEYRVFELNGVTVHDRKMRKKSH